ncbi:hypothetical protein LWC34_42855 [Kibdelosporangium philippinense]|uniref:Uncharacterized protein n=1 Tax=Kibdelosporangium philippinense TaxID=211113 RepID=A0ABS8ZPJ9_9PSEU|nr:hypothetical protein [Kibdelosporangium philippinense]
MDRPPDDFPQHLNDSGADRANLSQCEQVREVTGCVAIFPGEGLHCDEGFQGGNVKAEGRYVAISHLDGAGLDRPPASFGIEQSNLNPDL